MCSCVLFVNYSAMLDDAWFGSLCLCVCLLLLTVRGCRACEFLCDDACWILCVFVFMCLFNVLVCFVCDCVCDVVWSVVVCCVAL